jgi:AcrR family transcriptional regulator
MRALAAEAGCSVGLPYKVFTDRRDLVAQIVHEEVGRLRVASDRLIAGAGTGTVGDNLARFAQAFLNSPAVPLAEELMADPALVESALSSAGHAGLGPTDFPGVIASYLAAEQDADRVARTVDTEAFGFLIGGALHNHVIAGPAWPRPDRHHLERLLGATAAAIAAPS